uniref:DML1/Misato tubulin domain-containing protein n=1 Tax=Globisporangium ultimum (strain ATCC 200006 / CBS 805.95 / DAOM BR144) TaxID=431595 RepID=K3WV94_GLOUD
MSGNVEETLRLQFGTAANTISTQWLELHARESQDPRLMRADGSPRLIAFEAKDRVQKRRVAANATKRPRVADIQEQAAWTGNVQVYDQSEAEPVDSASNDNGLWNWSRLHANNLFEVDEFRAHMPLHNFYEGYAVSKDGSISNSTFEAAEERIRGVLEECDRLRFVQTLVDMDSSWGGFAHEILTYVSEECPSAVVVTFANDWTYPLADQSIESVFALTPDNRDKVKNEARKRINIASALGLLSEVSTLLVPIAMSDVSLPRASRFAHLHGVSSESCAQMGTIAATAIDLALSAYRHKSVYEVVEGVVPSRKIMELAARFPFEGNPVELLDAISNQSEVSTPQDDPLANASLLPAIPERAALRSRYEEDQDDDDEASSTDGKVFYRRFHLRGSFPDYSSSLYDSIQRVRSTKCVVQWTSDARVELSSSYRIPALAGARVDAVSQLSTSSRIGAYVDHVTQLLESADKRVLYEFTRSGMNPDAVEDLHAALGGISDAYQE